MKSQSDYSRMKLQKLPVHVFQSPKADVQFSENLPNFEMFGEDWGLKKVHSGFYNAV